MSSHQGSACVLCILCTRDRRERYAVILGYLKVMVEPGIYWGNTELDIEELGLRTRDGFFLAHVIEGCWAL